MTVMPLPSFQCFLESTRHTAPALEPTAPCSPLRIKQLALTRVESPHHYRRRTGKLSPLALLSARLRECESPTDASCATLVAPVSPPTPTSTLYTDGSDYSDDEYLHGPHPQRMRQPHLSRHESLRAQYEQLRDTQRRNPLKHTHAHPYAHGRVHAHAHGHAPDSAMSMPMPYRTKKKYLKERQRYEIVRRVRAGEKQAHLAKEFGVSRAAVCYLLKHQVEILNRSTISERMS